MMKEYVLDGTKTTSLEAFYDVISEVRIPNAAWGRNLDAFDDILRGDFGTPIKVSSLDGLILKLREQGLGIPRPSGN